MRSLHGITSRSTGRTCRDQPALVESQHAMTHARDKMMIVAGDKDAYSNLAELLEETHYFGGEFRLKVAGRFVGE
jgi:hypothetical protein